MYIHQMIMVKHGKQDLIQVCLVGNRRIIYYYYYVCIIIIVDL